MNQISAFFTILFISSGLYAGDGLNQYFSFMGFTLEETLLSEIQKTLGGTTVHKEGDAADSYTGICYRYPLEDVTIYFESGEMGGGKRLLSYKVMKGSTNKFPCREVSKSEHGHKFQAGDLKLGFNLDETIESLPRNTYSREGLFFWYIDKIPFTQEDIERTEVENMEYAFWNQTVTIELFSKGNTVTGYRVYKVTSW